MIIRAEEGAAAVEFALLVPLLLLLVMGAIDVGRAFYTHVSMVEAAQEGAVYASFHPASYTATRARVVHGVDDPALAPGDIAVRCPKPGMVSVLATHRMQLMTPVLAQWFGSGLTVQGHAEARILNESMPCTPSP